MRPAGGEDLEPRRGRQQLGRERCRLEQVLEVVEHEEQLAIGEEGLECILARLPAALLQRERLGDRVRHDLRLGHGRQRREPRPVGELAGHGACHLEREARLARAARAGEGQQAHAGAEDQRPDLLELPAAADERGQRRGQLGPAVGAGVIEPGVVDEDPPLQRAELLARFEAELVDECGARVVVGRERVGLPARPVERQHQLSGEALAQRVGPDGRRDLPGELGVPAGGEVVREASLERGQAQLLEPRDLGPGEVHEREVGECRTAPERERLAVAVLRDQLAEAVQVQLPGLDTQDVAGDPRLQPPGPEHPPQPRHVAVQLGHRRGGSRLAPQRVDQPVLRDDLVRAQQQVAEQRALAAALDGERAVVLHHLQRPQDPELDAVPPRSVRRYLIPLPRR